METTFLQPECCAGHIRDNYLSLAAVGIPNMTQLSGVARHV